MAIFGKKTEDTATSPAPAKTTAVTKTKEAKATEEKSTSMKDLYEAGTSAPKAKAKGDSKLVIKNGRAFSVLIKPLVTEKASILGEQNKYVFNVAISANKIEVAKAVYEVYGITPSAVNMVRVGGKKTRTGRIAGKRKDWKKAIVTLPKGKTIKIYEGVQSIYFKNNYFYEYEFKYKFTNDKMFEESICKFVLKFVIRRCLIVIEVTN